MSTLLILLVGLLTCLGQIAQKVAADSWRGRPMGLAEKLRCAWLWLALLAMGLGLVVWLLVLQRMDVGVAYPMLSINFVLITLAARWVFSEHVDRRHWLGVCLVMAGVALLGWQA